MIEFHTGRLSIAIAQIEAVGGRVHVDYANREVSVSRNGLIRFARFRDGNDIADAVMDFRDHAIGLREVKA